MQSKPVESKSHRKTHELEKWHQNENAINLSHKFYPKRLKDVYEFLMNPCAMRCVKALRRMHVLGSQNGLWHWKSF